MKNKNIEEYRKKTKDDLIKEERKLREKLSGLRFSLVAGKVKNIKEIRKIQKLIAQILTIMNEKKGEDSN